MRLWGLVGVLVLVLVALVLDLALGVDVGAISGAHSSDVGAALVALQTSAGEGAAGGNTHTHHHTHEHAHTHAHRHHLNRPLAMDMGDVDLRSRLLRGARLEGGAVRPVAPLSPSRPIADLLKKILTTIVNLVWSILSPVIIPLLTVLFKYVGPLLLEMMANPIMATVGPLLLNLAQRIPLLNKLLQMAIVPLFYLFVGIPQAPAFGLPYMSFHGPPYGSMYGQVSTENMRCYSILEEYIKRCTAPPNTLPLSFLQVEEVEPEDDAKCYVVSFLQDDDKEVPYEGAAAGGMHPPVWPGYAGPDYYDPYGPDGPEGDPAPNVGFQRCRELLDSWLNSCGTPTG